MVKVASITGIIKGLKPRQQNLRKKLKKRRLQKFTLIEVFIDIMAELKYLQKPYGKTEWNFNYGKF